MHSISALLAVSMAIAARGAPLGLGVGNSMQPEFHATALIPMLTGTNVPESEEEIDAPIYDEKEVEKIKGLMEKTAESGGNLENAPILGGFVQANPGILSTVATWRASGGSTDSDDVIGSTSPGPIFTLPAAIPTISTGKSA